ncbi:MAG: hypothetical protein KDD62_11230, partial [Bdellovibrionales bacterium]|nr:hypothetical protein [Bdellovibrionales bacterium]
MDSSLPIDLSTASGVSQSKGFGSAREEHNNIDFDLLPRVIEGESKDVRYLGDGLVAIRLKPTVYSFTHNRCDVVPGSDRIRLETSKTFLDVLKRAGIEHAYQEVLLDQ